ncbi:MAG: T9SS type A sorting domain-containing protein [Chitinophagaceae bacterium]|nr:T9SS type A sorting domain-containing protein [Chitinophagaceae bacterium]
MNKFIFLILVFIIHTSTCISQQHTFIKSIDDIGDILHTVPAQNGNFYVVSKSQTCPNDYIIVRYFDNAGNVLSSVQSFSFIGNISNTHAVALPNNDVLVYVRANQINHYLFQFNSTGTLMLSRHFQWSGDTVKYVKIVPAPDGFYLLGNRQPWNWQDSAKVVISKFSNTATHQWSKYYRINLPGTTSTHFNDMIYDQHQLICAGRYYSINGQVQFRPLLCKLDTSGNLIQSYYYMVDSAASFPYYEFKDIQKTPNGHYYLGAHTFGLEQAIFRTSPTWDIQWVLENYSALYHSICAGYQEDIWVASDDGPNDNYVMHFDSLGQYLSNHITKKSIVGGYDITYGNIVNLVQHDCGFLMRNSDQMYAHTNQNFDYCLDSTYNLQLNFYPQTNHYRKSAYLLHGIYGYPVETTPAIQFSTISTLIHTHCASTYACVGANGLSDQKLMELNIYPVLAFDQINIVVPANSVGALCDLLDLNGRILRQDLALKSGINPIDLHAIPSGIYVLRFRSDGQSQYHKIVKVE